MAYRFTHDEKFDLEIQLALGQVQAGAGTPWPGSPSGSRHR
ncbi:hypothetical protein [Nonomuraea sp. NPDC003754]